MKIKTKLTLAVGLLFTLIVLLISVAMWYTHTLKTDTENILVANYKSLQYANNLLLAMEQQDSKSAILIEENLQKQEKNVTEIGEYEHTIELRKEVEILKKDPKDLLVQTKIRLILFKIMDMNMNAIQRKSETAKTTANKALFWIAFTGVLCATIALFLLINLPANIANPIKELTFGMKEIADKKYTDKVHLQEQNEFGELANSFNTMVDKLEEYNKRNLAKTNFIATVSHEFKTPILV